jgi:hypothetical protein
MRRRRIVVLSLLVAGVAGGAGYWYHRQQASVAKALAAGVLQQLQTPHATTTVDARRWRQVGVGMTKQEVTQLLGEAPRRVGPISARGADGQEDVWPEFWEYGYVAAFASPVADARSYVVYFGPNERVTQVREPTAP